MKKKRIVTLMLCCLMLCFCLTGCGAKSSDGSKSIKVNIMNSKMTLKNVSYYDYLNNVKVNNYTGKDCAIMSNSYTTTEIIFYDRQGNLRVACVDKPFSNYPKKVKLYTNKKKTAYDMYEIEY